MDNWATGGSVLADRRVTSITVNPSNHLVAYATFKAPGSNGVFRTVDGGATWTSISANLPQVPAYSLVVDPRTSKAAPRGRIYVGTEVGVFVSINNGKSWTSLGTGLPNAPIVDLQFNKSFEVLVAATQGRGAFAISTDQFGPSVPRPSGPGRSAPRAASFGASWRPSPAPSRTTRSPAHRYLQRADQPRAVQHRRQRLRPVEDRRRPHQRQPLPARRGRGHLPCSTWAPSPLATQRTNGIALVRTQGQEALIAKIVAGKPYFQLVTDGQQFNNPDEQKQWFNAFVTTTLPDRVPPGSTPRGG